MGGEGEDIFYNQDTTCTLHATLRIPAHGEFRLTPTPIPTLIKLIHGQHSSILTHTGKIITTLMRFPSITHNYTILFQFLVSHTRDLLLIPCVIIKGPSG